MFNEQSFFPNKTTDEIEIEKPTKEINSADTEKQKNNLQEINTFLLEMQQGYTPDKEAKLEKKLLKPYRENECSFKNLLANNKTAPFVAEALRIIFSTNFENKKRDNNYSKKNDYEFIFNDLANSLNATEEQLKGNDFEESDDDPIQGKRRYRNNILYAISEALSSKNPNVVEKIDKWLDEHWEELKESSNLYTTPKGAIDNISEYTFINIALKTKNSQLLNKIMEISTDEEKQKTIHLEAKDLLTEECFMQRQEEIAKFLASKIGLDESIIKKWKVAKTGPEKEIRGMKIYDESYKRNIEAAERLEKKQPGSVKKLFKKFGIANFDRYDSETLLRQLEVEDHNTPYGVVVFPEADWNGAFFQNKYKLEKMRKKLLGGGYEMKIIEAASQLEMSRRLLNFHKKYSPGGNKIDFLAIGGHGTKSTVALGIDKELLSNDTPPPLPEGFSSESDYENALSQWQKTQQEPTINLKETIDQRTTMTAYDIKEGRGKGIRRAANEWFDQNAPVIFISCSTGIEGGIAQTTSKELGFKTIGPDRPTAIEEINVSFDNQGKPKFDVKYSKGRPTEDEPDEPGEPETMEYFFGERKNI